jgi:hypothetical protein
MSNRCYRLNDHMKEKFHTLLSGLEFIILRHQNSRSSNKISVLFFVVLQVLATPIHIKWLLVYISCLFRINELYIQGGSNMNGTICV